jgi:hypothetical protein
VQRYSDLSDAFAQAATDISVRPLHLPCLSSIIIKSNHIQANGRLSNADANTLFFTGPEAFVGDVVQALGIIAADATTKLQNKSTHPPLLADFVALEETFANFRRAVTVVTAVSLRFVHFFLGNTQPSIY